MKSSIHLIIILLGISLISFNSKKTTDLNDYYALKHESFDNPFERFAPDIMKYAAHSCVTPEGCCGIQCSVGSYSNCCIPTKCIFLKDHQQNAIANILGWPDLNPIMWNNISNEQLMNPLIVDVLKESVDFCLDQ